MISSRSFVKVEEIKYKTCGIPQRKSCWLNLSDTSTPTWTNSRGWRKEKNQQNTTLPPNSQSQSRGIPWLMVSKVHWRSKKQRRVHYQGSSMSVINDILVPYSNMDHDWKRSWTSSKILLSCNTPSLQPSLKNEGWKLDENCTTWWGLVIDP